MGGDIKLGGDNQAVWRNQAGLELIKLGGEYQAG